METVHEINPEEVTVLEGRHRKTFVQKEEVKLQQSIAEFGQKSPGLCRIVEDKVTLVFGERRLRACKELDIPYKYLLESEVDPVRLKEIELIENTHRLNLDFRDEARAIEELHRFKQEQIGEAGAGSSTGHGVRDTAEIVGVSATKVQEEIELSKFLEIEEVANAPSRTEARKTIKRLKEEYHRSEALKKARETAEEDGIIFQDDDSDDGASDGSPTQDITAKVSFYSEMIQLGRMEDELTSVNDGSYDLICFDPPWAVDYDSVSEPSGSKEIFEDSKEVIIPQMPEWLRLLYQKMAENSHLYLFFGIVHHKLVYDLLEDAGFETNRMPIIWYKQGAHRTRNADIWPGRSYEPIAYARKGKKLLVRKGAPDVIITPMPTANIKQQHTAGKHPDIYLELLKRSAMPGDKVLDPMCGTGMLGVAAETLRHTHQLKWTMIEEKESFVELALMNVVKGYYNIVKSLPEKPEDKTGHLFPFYLCYGCWQAGETSDLVNNPKTGKLSCCPRCNSGTFLEKELIESYKDMKIGSPEWKMFWEKNPELQGEMLNWKEGEGQ